MNEVDVYQALSERVGMPQSKLIPQVWQLVVTPEEANILLQLPADAEQLATKLNIDVGGVKEIMEKLVVKGVAIPLTKEGKERYVLPRSAGNLFESASHLTYEIVGEELLNIWGEWLQTEWLEELQYSSPYTSRVFPIPEAVEDRSQLHPVEDIWARVENTRRIAVLDCPCRLTLKRCEHTLRTCMLFDRGADVALRRGSGSEVSKEEAHKLMKEWGEEGLIPQGANRAKLTNLCWCCTDCCLVFYPQLTFGYNIIASSRYLAVVDPEACTGCQDCVDVCPVGVPEMLSTSGSKKLKAFIDAEECFGCGICVVNCSAGAIILKPVRPKRNICCRRNQHSLSYSRAITLCLSSYLISTLAFIISTSFPG